MYLRFEIDKLCMPRKWRKKATNVRAENRRILYAHKFVCVTSFEFQGRSTHCAIVIFDYRTAVPLKIIGVYARTIFNGRDHWHHSLKLARSYLIFYLNSFLPFNLLLRRFNILSSQKINNLMLRNIWNSQCAQRNL